MAQVDGQLPMRGEQQQQAQLNVERQQAVARGLQLWAAGAQELDSARGPALLLSTARPPGCPAPCRAAAASIQA